MLVFRFLDLHARVFVCAVVSIGPRSLLSVERNLESLVSLMYTHTVGYIVSLTSNSCQQARARCRKLPDFLLSFPILSSFPDFHRRYFLPIGGGGTTGV